jgi:ribulose-5-phosphate 4-epimerase/fuculose-1-phosphate aldolase
MAPWQTPLERVLLKELTACARLSYERGWCFGTAGNFSLRLRPELMWQSPSGLNKGNLQPELFLPIRVQDGALLDPLRSLVPSLEMPMHRGIYLGRPKARAVVHCHPPKVVKRSQQVGLEGLSFVGAEMIKALGAGDYNGQVCCPVLPNLNKSEMECVAEKLPSLLEEVALVILAGHGVYAWGQSPLEALAVVEALEFLCQTH